MTQGLEGFACVRDYYAPDEKAAPVADRSGPIPGFCLEGIVEKPPLKGGAPEAPQPNITALRLQLRKNGFNPIPVEGKIPPMKGWQQKFEVSEEEIRRWEKTYPRARNTGVLAKFTPGLDIDVTIEAAAKAAEDKAREFLLEHGDIHVRFGLPPKRLIPLRTDEPFAKLSRTFTAPDGSKQKIEMLGDGQQYVVHGIHRDTHKPYTWFGGELTTIKRENLPYTRHEDAEQILDAMAKVLIEEHGFVLTGTSRAVDSSKQLDFTQKSTASNDGEDPDRFKVAEGFADLPIEDLSVNLTLDSIYPPEEIAALRALGYADKAIWELEPKQVRKILGADPELIAAALAVIPRNDNDEHDDNYWTEIGQTPGRSYNVQIGMAVKAASNGSAEGFALFDKWRKDAPDYNADMVKKKWEGFHPTSIGFGTLSFYANKASPGWWEEYEARTGGSGDGGGTNTTSGIPGFNLNPDPQPSTNDGTALGYSWHLIWHGETDPTSVRKELVQDLLPETGVALISGQWGTYKTFIAIDLCAAAMTQTPFANKQVMRKGGVLFLACEGQSEVDIRLTAAFTKRGGTGNAPFAWVQGCPRLLNPNAKKILAAMVKHAAAKMMQDFGLPVVMVIIDTAGKAAGLSKQGELYDDAIAKMIMSTLAEASTQTGALFVGVAHFGKNVETGTKGSTGFEDDSDVVLALLGERGINGIVNNPLLCARKRRSGPNGEEFSFQTEEAKTLTIRWADATAAAKPKKKDDLWAAKSLRHLRQTMTNTLADCGSEQRPYPDGPIVRAVDIEIVRAEFYKSYPATGDEAAFPGEFPNIQAIWLIVGGRRIYERCAIGVRVCCAGLFSRGRANHGGPEPRLI